MAVAVVVGWVQVLMNKRKSPSFLGSHLECETE